MRDLIIKAVAIYGNLEKLKKDSNITPGVKKALVKYYKNELIDIKKEMEKKENEKKRTI